MKAEEAWTLEKEFWTGGEAFFREAMDPACVMAFPPPAGIIAADKIIDSLRGAPRWATVEFTETHLARPADPLVVLAYNAEGRRPGSEPYTACCTSTYRLDGGRWRLIQHQQTPL